MVGSVGLTKFQKRGELVFCRSSGGHRRPLFLSSPIWARGPEDILAGTTKTKRLRTTHRNIGGLVKGDR
jgi:hypothetical protein